MQRDPEFGQAYREFMAGYERLGHMRRISLDELEDQTVRAHYIPHHGIWQRSDEGRKLRVVFNASRPTSSGYSLNDILHVGPKSQNSIILVVIRWRMLRIVFCCDIKMMFRHIRIDSRYIHLQRVIWSESADQPAAHWVLETVTYGEAPSPYLADRTLQQLCLDEGEPFPLAKDAVKRRRYVDDIMAGGHDLESANKCRDQLTKLLSAGGFTLKKWVSNSPELLNEVSAEDRLRTSWIQFATDGPVNELGLAWDPTADCFKFTPSPLVSDLPPTKRRALVELAKIFDPAGWLAPVTVSAKMIIQDLWRAKLDWDDEIPGPLRQRWIAFRTTMDRVNELSIPRWTQHWPTNHLELHAFADASRRAIAAAIYCRTAERPEAEATTSLLWAKTKLSPVKNLISSTQRQTRMTIPRLELRAALLAARLLKTTADFLQVPVSSGQAWSDSQIVLHWIRSEEPTGNDFVDNYVTQIHELVPAIAWRYVSTTENPADAGIRGLEIPTLLQCRMWWTGPPWLQQPSSSWPVQPSGLASMGQDRLEPIRCFTTHAVAADIYPLNRFSDLTRALRTTARCRRLFTRRLQPESPKPLDPLTPDEMQREFQSFAKLCQRRDFEDELERLRQGRMVSASSALRTLAPFLDGHGVLRVGGRLCNSLLPMSQKHPIIISGRSHLARLIIGWTHHVSLHGGFKATYYRAIQRAWIIGGRRRVRSYIQHCTICVKDSARTEYQAMAPLPAVRVTPSESFSRVGVDYAGPFSVLRSKGRGVSSSKGYLALFVCLCTKAVHLELVGDLTTASFIGALDRVIARRGPPREIWSDNGTTFRGANAELHRMFKEAQLDWGHVTGSLAAQGVKWQFIPPSAPHFGGIWEAAVKSAKLHLRRVLGPRKLVYEEFATLLAEVERTLNCRPLTILTGDADDINILTSGHLVTGRSLTSLPKRVDATESLDHATHWTLIRRLQGHFWTRWSREYLNTLQQRHKWTRPQPNLRVGDVVLLVDPSLLRPSGQWPIGRIIATHPGDDKLVRTVSVKTANGTYIRPTTKIVRLPVTTPGQPTAAL